MAQDEATPATPSMAYRAMAPRWERIAALMGGTETMRAAQQTLMPKHEEESDAAYRRRLEGAVLLNMFELTLDSLAGKPFTDPVALDGDAPEPFPTWAENVDLQGNHIDVFARRWFRSAVAKGYSGVLVDTPRRDEVEGATRTLADDAAEARRPYLVHYEPENILFMSGTLVNGREVLDHVRLRECTTERQGWGEVEVTRIRVLEPGSVQLWRHQPEARRKQDEWVLEDEWATDLDVVTFVAYYSQRDGLGLSKPPLLDLAYLNTRHWQLDSDLSNILSVACFPILAASGVRDDGGLLRIGPNQVLATASESGRFYYVEHSGAAIGVGEAKLQRIEEAMASYGAQFLTQRPGSPTATARALDSAESLSELQSMALTFRDALEQVLMFMAMWAGIDPSQAPSVIMNLDFGLNDPDETGWKAIEAARTRREVSRLTVITEMKRRGWLDDSYDPDADKEQIMAEDADIFGPPTTDLDPGQKDDKPDDDKPDGE